jgi:alpha-tubulin suppressor-like RCC1 family protein
MDSNEIYEDCWAKDFENIFKLNLKTKSPIQIIQTGSCHTIAINNKGKLFSWGWNHYGQCGHPFYCIP